MNRLTLITLLPCLFLASTAKSQYIQAYAHAGAITAQIEGDELKGFKHWGFTGGVGTLVRFDDYGTWSMALEANYSNRGVHNNMHTIDNLYNININLKYVDIPLTLFFKDPIGGLRIGFGPVYSRLVQQPHDTISFNSNHFSPDTSDMSFLKNDLSLAGELRFTVWNNLQLSVRYQHSILPVKKGWSFTEDNHTWANDCYNQSISFRLLWQFGEPDKSPHKKKQPRQTRPHNKPRVTVRRHR